MGTVAWVALLIALVSAKKLADLGLETHSGGYRKLKIGGGVIYFICLLQLVPFLAANWQPPPARCCGLSNKVKPRLSGSGQGLSGMLSDKVREQRPLAKWFLQRLVSIALPLGVVLALLGVMSLSEGGMILAIILIGIIANLLHFFIVFRTSFDRGAYVSFVLLVFQVTPSLSPPLRVLDKRLPLCRRSCILQ